MAADGTLQLHAPGSWQELTQEQLRYVLTLIAQGWDEYKARTYMLCRLCGIRVLSEKRDGWLCESLTDDGSRVRYFLATWQVMSMCEQFDYVFDGKGAANRLDRIGSLRAAEVELHGLPFANYLTADNFFQQYLQSGQRTNEPLCEMARCLYLRADGTEADSVSCTDAELVGVFLWFCFVKDNFAQAFPHLFKPAADVEGYDPRTAMDAQIRALTEGDITKEDQILNADTWRALTELDAKAREAEEMNEKLKHT